MYPWASNSSTLLISHLPLPLIHIFTWGCSDLLHQQHFSGADYGLFLPWSYGTAIPALYIDLIYHVLPPALYPCDGDRNPHWQLVIDLEATSNHSFSLFMSLISRILECQKITIKTSYNYKIHIIYIYWIIFHFFGVINLCF